jgi:ribonuclease BN (tRNA processing enzyme)
MGMPARDEGGVSEVRLQFLGSGDAFGSGGRLQTCLHLTGAHAGSVLIDCGASSLIGMKRAGIDPSGIEWILITHLHGDHFGGVPFMILDGQFSRRSRPLTIAGPPGIEARVKAAMEIFFPGSTAADRQFSIEFVEWFDRRPATLGPAVVTPFPVVHASGAPAYALRVHYRDQIVGYSGDTEWTEALIEAADGADVFVCEAYFFDKKIKYHLDYQTVMAHRSRLRCRRLILAHMSHDMLERLGMVDVEVAQDLEVLTIA